MYLKTDLLHLEEKVSLLQLLGDPLQRILEGFFPIFLSFSSIIVLKSSPVALGGPLRLLPVAAAGIASAS